MCPNRTNNPTQKIYVETTCENVGIIINEMIHSLIFTFIFGGIIMFFATCQRGCHFDPIWHGIWFTIMGLQIIFHLISILFNIKRTCKKEYLTDSGEWEIQYYYSCKWCGLNYSEETNNIELGILIE